MKNLEDFKEFITLLNKYSVKYLLVGGYAVSFHAKPRFTNDMDVWVEASKENAEKVLGVLQEFGFGDLEITVADLSKDDTIIQLGYEPLRIDIMTSLSGIKFGDAYPNRIEADYFGIKTNIISMQDIVKNKRSTGRKQDLQDIEWLKKYGKESSKF